MADDLKVLGQLDPSATTVTTLYTVPDMTQTTISSIVAANRTGSAITFMWLEQVQMINSIYTMTNQLQLMIR